MLCVTFISTTEGISTKDLYESNHNTDQFADERESVIHDVDAQPIAHDVQENEKRALYRTVGSVLKQGNFFETPKKRAIFTDPTPEIGCLLIFLELSGQHVGHVGAATHLGPYTRPLPPTVTNWKFKGSRGQTLNCESSKKKVLSMMSTFSQKLRHAVPLSDMA